MYRSRVIYTSPSRSSTERRRHTRERFAATAHMLLPGRRIVEARTLDISAGGLRVVAPANLPITSLCNVRLRIPGIPSGVHTVMARARVASNVFSGRESGFLLGLSFTEIARPARAAVERYVQEKSRGTSRPRAQAARTASRAGLDGFSGLIW
jgi:c-di-GMP-binding flagellar brake protein YcgR